eukprot:357392-Chlamydomonas_euryale.AAC.54
MVGDNAGWQGPWPSHGRPWPGKMLMYPRCDVWRLILATCTWEDAKPNVGLSTYGMHVANNMGPEMCFGRSLIEANISSQIGFIPVALGGSILARDWKPQSR